MDTSSDHLTLAPGAFMNVYLKRSWTSLEVFPLLERDYNNDIICRALTANGGRDQPPDKQAPSPAVLHMHTNPTSSLPLQGQKIKAPVNS